jgi:hypothetical protein
VKILRIEAAMHADCDKFVAAARELGRRQEEQARRQRSALAETPPASVSTADPDP